MAARIFTTLVFFCLVLACTKGDDKPVINRELSPLGKKLIGKWKLINLNPAPGDFWEFKDEIIDSLSNDSVTYRVYIDSVQQSLCSRRAKWFEKDSVLFGTCVPNAHIVKLTDDTLFFRYYAYGTYLEYRWTKLR